MALVHLSKHRDWLHSPKHLKTVHTHTRRKLHSQSAEIWEKIHDQCLQQRINMKNSECPNKTRYKMKSTHSLCSNVLLARPSDFCLCEDYTCTRMVNFLMTSIFTKKAAGSMQTSPPGQHRSEASLQCLQRSGNGLGGELRGRTPWGWTEPARISCWGHGEHLKQLSQICVK